MGKPRRRCHELCLDCHYNGRPVDPDRLPCELIPYLEKNDEMIGRQRPVLNDGRTGWYPSDVVDVIPRQ